MKNENITSLKKSLDNILMICSTLDPSTFLIPISLNRCSAVNVIKPNNPKQATKMVSVENIVRTSAIFLQ